MIGWFPCVGESQRGGQTGGGGYGRSVCALGSQDPVGGVRLCVCVCVVCVCVGGEHKLARTTNVLNC